MRKINFCAVLLCMFASFASCDEFFKEDGDETEVENGGSSNTNGGNGTDNSQNNNQVNNTPTNTCKYGDYTAEQCAKANTAKNADMSEVDKDIIYLCNLARLDGTVFWNSIAKPYIGNNTNSSTQSLESDLKALKDLAMLIPDQGLYNAAKAHAEDMRKNNFFAHDSFDGTDTFVRIKKYYSGFACNENIAAGNSRALDIVMQWLVDKNTPTLGHRKAILGTRPVAIGVYTGQHPDWRYVSVQDFGTTVITPMD